MPKAQSKASQKEKKWARARRKSTAAGYWCWRQRRRPDSALEMTG